MRPAKLSFLRLSVLKKITDIFKRLNLKWKQKAAKQFYSK